jgi:F0F1-type ATP synthase assembly protein I
MSNGQSTTEKCDARPTRLTHFVFYGLVFGAGVGIVLGSVLDAIPLGLTFGPSIGLATGWAINRWKT